MVGRQSRTEALVAQKPEVGPRWSSRVALEDVIPLLSVPGHVERGQPNFVDLPGELATEKGFSPVEPAQGVLFAVIERERELVELGNAIAFIVIVQVGQRLGSVGAFMVHHR